MAHQLDELLPLAVEGNGNRQPLIAVPTAIRLRRTRTAIRRLSSSTMIDELDLS